MKIFFCALALLFGCSPQQQAHPRPPSSQQSTSAGLASQDRDFLEHAAEGNNAEVAIGGLVDGRAEGGGVVELGKMMVRDHSAAQAKLSEVARQLSIALPASLGDHQAGYDKLVDRKGQPFDTEFVRVMIGDHQQAVQLYKSEISTGINEPLKAYAQSTLPAIEAHLAHAQALAVSH